MASDIIERMNNIDLELLGNDEVQRRKVVASAKALCSRLEHPVESITRMIWSEPMLCVAVKIAVDLKLFQAFDHLDQTLTTQQLASYTKSSEALLRRILRILAAGSVLREVKNNLFGPTSLSYSLKSDGLSGGYTQYFASYIKLCQAAPEHLAQSGYLNPADLRSSIFNTAHNTPMTSWEYSVANPDFASRFNNFMSTATHGLPRWVTKFPVSELRDGLSPERDSVQLVDIGGGIGQDLAIFHETHPEVPGRLILQDLPAAVEYAAQSLDPAIETMPHDFFTEQPIRGSRVYFLGSVLHDWPDREVRQILSCIKPAMKPGYSRILLHENVLPEVRVPMHLAALDLLMMMLFSSGERTEANWRILFESVGLTLVKIYGADRSGRCVLDVRLMSDSVRMLKIA